MHNSSYTCKDNKDNANREQYKAFLNEKRKVKSEKSKCGFKEERRVKNEKSKWTLK